MTGTATGRKLSLKAARELSGYTQQQAATQLNVNTDTLRSWEQYKTSPVISNACKLCRLYGIPFEFIRWRNQPEEITISFNVMLSFASVIGMSIEDLLSVTGIY